jgi:hypothetical protein
MSKVTREKNKEYMDRYKKKHPIRYRNCNKVSARKYRERNKEKFQAYNNTYYKKWLLNDVNRKCHRARTKVSSIKNILNRNNGVFKRQPSQETLIIYNNLLDINWHHELSSEVCLNHKISLKLVFSFYINIPLSVVFDVRNLELIPRELNNCVSKRRVNAEVIQTAQVLENKYPEWLTGFTSFLKERRGEVN